MYEYMYVNKPGPKYRINGVKVMSVCDLSFCMSNSQICTYYIGFNICHKTVNGILLDNDQRSQPAHLYF